MKNYTCLLADTREHLIEGEFSDEIREDNNLVLTDIKITDNHTGELIFEYNNFNLVFDINLNLFDMISRYLYLCVYFDKTFQIALLNLFQFNNFTIFNKCYNRLADIYDNQINSIVF